MQKCSQLELCPKEAKGQRDFKHSYELAKKVLEHIRKSVRPHPHMKTPEKRAVYPLVDDYVFKGWLSRPWDGILSGKILNLREAEEESKVF